MSRHRWRHDRPFAEIKSEYLDPQIIERTKEQVEAKKDALTGYNSKVVALESLIATLRTNQGVKAQSLNYKKNAAKAAASADSTIMPLKKKI